MPEPPALALETLRSGYGALEVLHGIHLAIQPREICAVVGRNGMGKSTLLKAVMGILPGTTGSVKIFGHEMCGQPAHRVARLAVSYVPQEKALFQDLSVEENLRLGLRHRGEFAQRLEWVREVFPFLGTRLRQLAGTLSGGEQRMLLMTRALISRPRLLLMDEISEGVQPLVLDRVHQVLDCERNSRELAILLVEQNLGFAFSLAERYAVLKLGEVVACGSTANEDTHAIAAEHLII